MVNRQVLLVVVVLAVAVAAFAFFGESTGAQQRPVPQFDGVQVITYASGLTGFFQRDTGTLYVYDANWDKCFAVRKLSSLGQPMKDVRNPRR